MLTVDLWGPGVSKGSPWNESDFDNLCSRHGLRCSYVVKDLSKQAGNWKGDVQIQMRINETEPSEVTQFMAKIIEWIADDGEPTFTIVKEAGKVEQRIGE
ncbi:hypothetical protein ACFQJC_14380 [Haloferax namakaokahaiae]|uniref:Uncharacterized protein n=1 Tax=Haloferax namakaokahaiae TaxID=1748331 RepID=A0ABD5ZHJ3_9EURY